MPDVHYYLPVIKMKIHNIRECLSCACCWAKGTNENANVLAAAVLHINTAYVCGCVLCSLFFCACLNNWNVTRRVQSIKHVNAVLCFRASAHEHHICARWLCWGRRIDTDTGWPPLCPAYSSNLVTSLCWIPTTAPLLQQPSRIVSWDVGKGRTVPAAYLQQQKT